MTAGVVPVRLQHLLCHCWLHLAHLIYVEDLSDFSQGQESRLLLVTAILGTLVSLSVTFTTSSSSLFLFCRRTSLYCTTGLGWVPPMSLRLRAGLDIGELPADLAPVLFLGGALRFDLLLGSVIS